MASRDGKTAARVAVRTFVSWAWPLALLLFTVSGAWIGSLAVADSYRPFFAALMLLLLGLGFYKLYVVPRVVAPGTPSAEVRALKRQRVTFWLVAWLLLGLLSVPRLAAFFS
jgi:mercuric ion transport protein